MVLKNSISIGKVLYSLLFVVILPTLLIVWAKFSEDNVPLPAIGSFPIGMVVTFFGVVTMILGMVALYMYGNGLPMSPFPPSRYVSQGIYRFVSHPIYFGFSVLCIGIAITSYSASGLWLVSPVVILCCVALVQGFEKQELYRRFGDSLSKPLISLPANETSAPNFSDRLSVYLLVLLPWLILYQAVRALGIPPDAFNAFFSFEMDLPVYEWTGIFYMSTYIIVLLVPLFARAKHDLREFAIFGLISAGLIILLFLAIPVISPPRPYSPHSFIGTMLDWVQKNDTPTASFPSSHVVWTFLAVGVFVRRMPSVKILWWGWALLVSISCITTGTHAIVDVIGGFVVFMFVTHIQAVWEKTRQLAERIANSWKEWHFGPVRIINHGIYAGIGTFIGFSIVGILIGPKHIVSIFIVALSSLIVSALWAQFIEGSPKLLRPYGYYGGVLGIVLGSLIAQMFGTSVWLLLAAFSISGPWVQSAGRLRCLVQGCCHGRVVPNTIGIRYSHPKSRVCRLADLEGVPIHPTPVYSILWNVVVAIIITRLWFLSVSLPLIGGLYLILTGLGRFVEESYRGEPQTSIIAGLRLYQWLAIVTVVGGAVVSTLNTTAVIPAPEFNWESIAFASVFGIFTWFALGVDFPNSNRRFARLV